MIFQAIKLIYFQILFQIKFVLPVSKENLCQMEFERRWKLTINYDLRNRKINFLYLFPFSIWFFSRRTPLFKPTT